MNCSLEDIKKLAESELRSILNVISSSEYVNSLGSVSSFDLVEKVPALQQDSSQEWDTVREDYYNRLFILLLRKCSPKEWDKIKKTYHRNLPSPNEISFSEKNEGEFEKKRLWIERVEKFNASIFSIACDSEILDKGKEINKMIEQISSILG